jgi:hypothetical protein
VIVVVLLSYGLFSLSLVLLYTLYSLGKGDMKKDISKIIVQAAEGLTRAAKNSTKKPSADLLKINTRCHSAENSTKLGKNDTKSENPELDAPKTPIQEAVKREGMNGPLPRLEVTSRTPVPDALNQQNMMDFSHSREKCTLSSPMQGCIEYARKIIFNNKSHFDFAVSNRYFYTSSRFSEINFPRDGVPSSISTDQWPPKSVADIGPPKKLADDLEERRKEILMRFLKDEASQHRKTVTDTDYKNLCKELTQVVSDDLEEREICTRFNAQKLLNATEKGYFQSTHQTQDGAGRNFNQYQLKHIASLQLALSRYPLDTLPEDRPFHGIATKDPYGQFDNEYLEDFGDVSLFFDPRVKKLSHVIGGDSLRLVNIGMGGDWPDSMRIDASPEPLEKPTYKILPVYKEEQHVYGSMELVPWDPRKHGKNLSNNFPFQYYEVHINRIFVPQILGQDEPLGPQNTTRAIIGDPVRLGKEMTLKVKRALLDKYGIPCYVGKNDKHSEDLRQKYKWIEEEFEPMPSDITRRNRFR